MEILPPFLVCGPDFGVLTAQSFYRRGPWSNFSARGYAYRILGHPVKPPLRVPALSGCTRLTSGQDALTVAKLMGHVDTRMIATRYGHLESNSDYMQEAANQIGFPGLPAAGPDIPNNVPGQPA